MIRSRFAAFLLLFLPLITGCEALGSRDKTYTRTLDPARFQKTVDNPCYPLVPGTVFTFVSESEGETSVVAS